MKRFVLRTIMIIIFLAFSVNITAQPIFALEKENIIPLELDGTEWEVEVVSITAKGKKMTETDKLFFKDKKFISESFEQKKYSPTNYSVTLTDEGNTSFGTMQNKDNETSFWKGEVKDQEISGTIYVQESKGKTKDYYFTGRLISGVLKPKVMRKVITPPVVPQPVQVIKQELQVEIIDESKMQVTEEVKEIKEEIKESVDQ